MRHDFCHFCFQTCLIGILNSRAPQIFPAVVRTSTHQAMASDDVCPKVRGADKQASRACSSDVQGCSEEAWLCHGRLAASLLAMWPLGALSEEKLEALLAASHCNDALRVAYRSVLQQLRAAVVRLAGAEATACLPTMEELRQEVEDSSNLEELAGCVAAFGRRLDRSAARRAVQSPRFACGFALVLVSLEKQGGVVNQRAAQAAKGFQRLTSCLGQWGVHVWEGSAATSLLPDRDSLLRSVAQLFLRDAPVIRAIRNVREATAEIFSLPSDVPEQTWKKLLRGACPAATEGLWECVRCATQALKKADGGEPGVEARLMLKEAEEEGRAAATNLRAGRDEQSVRLLGPAEELVEALQNMRDDSEEGGRFIFYLGPTDPGTGDWMCQGGRTVALEDVLRVRRRCDSRAKPLVIVVDGGHSGRWCQAAQGREDEWSRADSRYPLHRGVIIQAACGPEDAVEAGLFTERFLQFQHPSSRKLSPDELATPLCYAPPDQSLLLWPRAVSGEESRVFQRRGAVVLLGRNLLARASPRPNPGSAGHPRCCKKPCNKFVPKKPGSCKFGAECNYCHEDHERHSLPSQASRFAEARRWFQNSKAPLNEGHRRLYELVYATARSSVDEVLKLSPPERVERGEVIAYALMELQECGEKAQNLRPDAIRLTLPRISRLGTPKHASEAELNERCRWVEGVLHTLVRQLLERGVAPQEIEEQALCEPLRMCHALPVSAADQARRLSELRQGACSSASASGRSSPALEQKLQSWTSVVASWREGCARNELTALVSLLADRREGGERWGRMPDFQKLVLTIDYLLPLRKSRGGKLQDEEDDVKEVKESLKKAVGSLTSSSSPRLTVVLKTVLEDFEVRGDAVPPLPLDALDLDVRSRFLLPHVRTLYERDKREATRNALEDEAVDDVERAYGSVVRELFDLPETLHRLMCPGRGQAVNHDQMRLAQESLLQSCTLPELGRCLQELQRTSVARAQQSSLARAAGEAYSLL